MTTTAVLSFAKKYMVHGTTLLAIIVFCSIFFFTLRYVNGPCCVTGTPQWIEILVSMVMIGGYCALCILIEFFVYVAGIMMEEKEPPMEDMLGFNIVILIIANISMLIV